MSLPLTDSFPDISGQALDDGRYLVLETLGAGSYGKVYRAFDNDNRSYCAIKCLLKPEPGSREDYVQTREFALHRQVSEHANIVTFHRDFFDECFVYVVLDLCDGGDLFGAIVDRQIFQGKTELIKATFLQLLDAVSFCHEQHNVFHRDLKPENILYSKSGGVFLADFGLSTQNPVSQAPGCGSSFYMSPECIGKEYGNERYSNMHSDVWALGIIFANMICGRNPWARALTTDPCYNAYLHDRDFLYKVLPISETASSILQSIFTVNPLCRSTLPMLRTRIIEANTFFKTEEEIAMMSIEETTEQEVPRILVDSCEVEDADSFGESSFGSSATAFLFPFRSDLSRTDQERPAQQLAVGRFAQSTSLNTNSSSSSSDSSGPITPATFAVEPEVEVPDMPEGQDLNVGESTSIIAPTVCITKPLRSPVLPAVVDAPRKPRRGRAAQFFKAISARFSAST